MKAIDTLYKGVYFRSRTEARWAVFFDALGIRWEYEKEGYDLGDGIYYLPDFWFPDDRMYGEVKGQYNIDWKDMQKMQRLCEQSKRTVCLFVGIPDRAACTTFCYDQDTGEVELRDRDECNDIPFRHIAMGRKREDEWGVYWCGESDPSNEEPWKSAIRAAQIARFEHGARP
jgi:hypothetical protein